MKKIVVSIFVAALGSYAAAQNIGNSPYAAYGIGDIKYDNSVETRSMGGISTAYVWDFNNQFNLRSTTRCVPRAAGVRGGRRRPLRPFPSATPFEPSLYEKNRRSEGWRGVAETNSKRSN